MIKRSLLLVLLINLTVNLLGTTFAATLSLYATPSTHAKIVKILDANTKLIPIYYPKTNSKKKTDNVWLKVADPNSGEVGWVKLQSIKGPLTLPRFNGQFFEQETVMTHQGDGKPVRQKTYRRFGYTASDEKSRAENLGRLFIHMQYQLKDMQMLIDQFINTLARDMSTEDDNPFLEKESSFFNKKGPRIKPHQSDNQPSWWEKLKAKLMHAS